ncbi:hypothetical protein [Elizabethkingia anophelis]|uniref:hypothetical protein n=1 Tax=Elizabethkingia anophelis TaxID=1117645 RepID=UPI003462BAF2
MNKYKDKQFLKKSKLEIFNILGEGGNFYSEDLWIYDLKKSLLGIKETILFLEFENDLVKKSNIKNFYFRIYN